MKNLKRGIISALMLLIFGWYYSGITLFPHTHIVNGCTIVHSHPLNPFDNSAKTHHNHTGKEYNTIQLLSDFTTIVIALISLSFIFCSETSEISGELSSPIVGRRFDISLLKRGPPLPVI